MDKRYRETLLRYSVLLFCLVWIIYMMQHAEVPADVGDGIAHYFISQASWYNPSLFLHHWGKPFYILLSSPFAQFGFNGLVLFNVIVFALTVSIGFKIMQQKNVTVWLQLLFPLILLTAHDFANTILGGLTEPLFNLAAILGLYLLLNKRYFWFALVVSFMPFMRSEGQLPVLLAVFLLIYYRSYRSIPVLLTGFVLYGFAGIVVYGEFWWYFTESPYSLNNAIYGKGSWSHYILSYKNYLGNPGLYILMVGIPTMIFLLMKRRWKEFQFDWWFWAYGTFVGVLFSHSYFYATGTNGSYGLTRIATQGVPVFILLHLYYLNTIKLSKQRIASMVYALFSLIMIFSLIKNKNYPKKAKPLDEQIFAAADFLQKTDREDRQIFFYAPLLCYALKDNNYLPDSKMRFFSFTNLDENLIKLFKPGDLIVRDSHFGPLEMKLPLNVLTNHPDLVRIKEFVSAEQLDDPMGETEGVMIYEFRPDK